MDGRSEIRLISEEQKNGGRCPPYDCSEQEFAPTIGTCGSEFRLEFTLKLPSLLESGAVESQGSRRESPPILVAF